MSPAKDFRLLALLRITVPSFAWVVSAQAADPPCSPAHDDFDPDTSAATDPNGLPLNARWSYQKANPGFYPHPETCCGGFPDNFPRGNPPCTTVGVSIDGPNFGHKFFCDFGTSNFSGHLNWLPATYDGLLTWESHESAFFGDDDYTFNLRPRGGEGLTSNNAKGLHVEMNGDETIDGAQVGWWYAFRKAKDATKSAMLKDDAGVPATVVGLLGIDNVHGGYSELHPAYAVGILTDRKAVAGGAVEDTWAILARNWGNEGWCSSDQHEIHGLPPEGIGLRLKLAPLASASVLSADFRSNHNGIAGPQITREDDAIVVRFQLPDPSERPFVHGDLHLRWTPRQPQTVAMSLAAGPAAVPARGERELRQDEGESLKAVLERFARPEAYSAFTQEIGRSQYSLVKPPSEIPPEAIRERRPAPTAKAVADSKKKERQARQIELLCDAAQRAWSDPAAMKSLTEAMRQDFARLREDCAPAH